MALCKIVLAAKVAMANNPGEWEASVTHRSGTMPIIKRNRNGTITGSVPGVAVEALAVEPPVGSSITIRVFALVLTGEWSVLRSFAPADMFLRVWNTNGQMISPYGDVLPRVMMYWGCNKSGDRWVFPEWAVSSPNVLPLPDHNVSSLPAYHPLWQAAWFGTAGSATASGPFKYVLNDPNVPLPAAWLEQTAPVNGANIAANAPYFEPSASGKLYDNGVYAPPAPPPTAPVIAPTVPSTGTGATQADLANLESRLVAVQQGLNDVLTALSRVPSAQEVRELLGQRARENVTINQSIAAVGDYMVSKLEAQPSSQTQRLAEMAGVSLVTRLIAGR